VTLWRGLADVVDKYVHKGSQLYIEGSLRTREWTDKDNQKRYTTEIVATEMKLLGRRGDAQPQTGVAQDYAQPSYQQPAAPQVQQIVTPEPPAAPAVPAESGDDLPF
jgi:single-strand DNA-binding protein